MIRGTGKYIADRDPRADIEKPLLHDGYDRAGAIRCVIIRYRKLAAGAEDQAHAAILGAQRQTQGFNRGAPAGVKTALRYAVGGGMWSCCHLRGRARAIRHRRGIVWTNRASRWVQYRGHREAGQQLRIGKAAVSAEFLAQAPQIDGVGHERPEGTFYFHRECHSARPMLVSSG